MENFTKVLQSISSKLLKKKSSTATTPSTTPSEAGPEDRNKLSVDQYDELRVNGEKVLSKVNAWLGFDDEGKTLRNLCRRFLKMHGFLVQDKKEISQLQSDDPNKTSGGDLT